MSEPIKVGDWVQVVKWPCCGSGLGEVFVVHAVFNPNGWHHCLCGKGLPSDPFLVSDGAPALRRGAPLSWLKRIPPPSELESEKNNEELTA